MSLVEVVVVVAGAALIVGELWFFLGPRQSPKVPSTPATPQEIKVLVKNGYEPDTIPVEVGRPVRLLFYRDETEECSARVIFDGLGIERELPPFQTTPVEFTPVKPGDYSFHCGLSVMHGRVVALAGWDGARANLGKGHAKHG
ncbi:MAG: cupredoxin domain-containing protein [Gemmatimonadota bacterium]|nr:MAG: cupredoxin domain-containing protein [Gemmatimonadota bacterium]